MLKQRNEKAGAKERKARKRACRGQKAAFEKAKKPLSYVEKIRSDADCTAIGLQKHCYQWAIALQSEAKSYANGGRLHSFWNTGLFSIICIIVGIAHKETAKYLYQASKYETLFCSFSWCIRSKNKAST